jgi:steroid delta-isomerase-like uncharacterized protein
VSTEHNKALVRRCWEACFNQGNLTLVDELCVPDYAWHGPSQEITSAEGIKHLITTIRTGLPDLQMIFEDQFAEGDKVATRWTVRGTHTGELFGIPATSRQTTFAGLIISRIADGKIIEEWEQFDQLGLLQQLGALPAPEPAVV